MYCPSTWVLDFSAKELRWLWFAVCSKPTSGFVSQFNSKLPSPVVESIPLVIVCHFCEHLSANDRRQLRLTFYCDILKCFPFHRRHIPGIRVHQRPSCLWIVAVVFFFIPLVIAIRICTQWLLRCVRADCEHRHACRPVCAEFRCVSSYVVVQELLQVSWCWQRVVLNLHYALILFIIPS